MGPGGDSEKRNKICQQKGFYEANSRVPWRYDFVVSCPLHEDTQSQECIKATLEMPAVLRATFQNTFCNLASDTGYQCPQVPKAPESLLQACLLQSAAETVSEMGVGPNL